MAVEVRPLGVKCNISCHYCYQEPVRAAGSNAKKYDLEAIKEAVIKKGGPFTLFGGEPLLMPIVDIEDLFAWGLERFGGSSIQTNGTLITENHIALFKRYKVHVGVSIDGPDECNSPRWAGSTTRTIAATFTVERVIDALLANGIFPSIITTLHRANASREVLPRLLEWFRTLDVKGVRFARIHMLEVDSERARQDLALSLEENAAAMLALDNLERNDLRTLRFDLFKEIEGLLLAKDKGVSCVWRACDPYTTEAVQGIEGFGQSSNCGRTNKAGIDFLKADSAGFERYLALYQTDQQYGGCKGCRFFLVCKGQCPGTSIDGDWRNRTEHCSTWFRLFEHVESRLTTQGFLPISIDPNRKYLESAMLAQWISQRNPSLSYLLIHMRQQAARQYATPEKKEP